MNTASAFELKIDKGIEIPARSRYSTVSKYPFKKMEAGDSFVVSTKSIAQIYTAAKRADVKVTVRHTSKPDKEGNVKFRVWRVQ